MCVCARARFTVSGRSPRSDPGSMHPQCSSSAEKGEPNQVKSFDRPPHSRLQCFHQAYILRTLTVTLISGSVVEGISSGSMSKGNRRLVRVEGIGSRIFKRWMEVMKIISERVGGGELFRFYLGHMDCVHFIHLTNFPSLTLPVNARHTFAGNYWTSQVDSVPITYQLLVAFV